MLEILLGIVSRAVSVLINVLNFKILLKQRLEGSELGEGGKKKERGHVARGGAQAGNRRRSVCDLLEYSSSYLFTFLCCYYHR